MKLRLGLVESVEPVIRRVHISGVGESAVFEEHQLGWKITVGLSSFVLPAKFNSDNQVISLPEIINKTATIVIRE